jgi:hypothetical protein
MFDYKISGFMHSGVFTNNTATVVSLAPLRCATNFVEYLRVFEVIFKKAVTCVSGA